MPYQKNDTVQVKISDFGSAGEGIGKIEGYTLFIKDTVIGDVVEAKIMKAKKNYGYARLEKVLQPSPFRVEPKCRFAKSCGGCQLQAYRYDKQLELKNRIVKNNLIHIGGFSEELLEGIMEKPVGMNGDGEEPYHYRNKSQFPFGYDRDGNVITGFYAGRTHSIIANTDCILGAEENEAVLKAVLSYMKDCNVSAYREQDRSGLIRHVLIRKGFHTGELMVCLVINGTELPKETVLTEKLAKIKGMTSISFSVNRENTNVIMGKEIHTIWGNDRISDEIGNLRFTISPLSFFQVNPVQTERIYNKAL